ncbi:MAG: RIP metalloprotease RseP [Magnetococcales bacterium]|nr:RIP metalloprotease RseP [Magnetococcales bacterium]
MNTVFWALLVLGILIFVHELGHFLAARLFGVRVLIFSLGFGPRLWSWKSGDGETEYQLSAIPLGGYVKMLGEGEEEGEGEGEEENRPLTEEELPHAFSSQSVGRRIGIVFAGPAFNFIFAFLFLVVAYMVGVGEALPVVGKVSPEMPALEAGLQPGDRITHIDDQPVERWRTLSQIVRASDGNPLQFDVLRGESSFRVEIAPRIQEVPNLFGEPERTALIGISPGDAEVVVQYGPLESIGKGLEQTWRMTDLTLTSIWKLVTRVISADQIGGPLLIAELAGKTASQGATNLLFFMALISINLGILNLLPIPVLDGGHLLFFSIEGLKGSPVSEKAQMFANRVGMVFLIMVMVWAMKNDLVRLFSSG